VGVGCGSDGLRRKDIVKTPTVEQYCYEDMRGRELSLQMLTSICSFEGYEV
jgi:hypothetical protein